MNESIFFFHILLTLGFSFAALRMGKTALLLLLSLQAICANVFVLKEITLFGSVATASDVFAVGSLLTLNCMQNFFGKEAAKRGIVLCFFSLVFVGLMSQIHLFYVPSPLDAFDSHYSALFLPAPRLFFASLLSFLLVQLFDLSFFQFLTTYTPSLGWRGKNIVALLSSQVLDTLLFSFLGLYGTLPSLGSIIWISLSIKAITALLLSLAPLPWKKMKGESLHEI